MKRRLLCLMLCAVMVLTSGCVSSLLEEKESTGETLPEVRSGPEATVADSQTPWITSAVLYVPGEGATRLDTVVQSIVVESGKTKHEAYVEALLRLADSNGFNSTTQQLRLSPVSNAVETSGDLVTVNMHTSMRSLTAQEQFALRMAITNTLTELPEVRYVNILVNGRDIGLDVGETVPTGVMDRYSGSDVVLHWSQIQSERTSLSGELVKRVAMYFVSEDGNHLLGEVRNLTFAEHDSALYAKVILEEMSKGASSISNVRTVVPEQDWFERNPTMVEIDGDIYVELHFHSGISGFLELRNSTMGMMLSSICYTLTGFIPKLDGIVAYVGGELVTQMTLMNGEPWVMSGGQITREGLAAFTADLCTVYYPLENGARLYAVQRPIAQRQRTQPRALLRELMKDPGVQGLARAFPEGITDADIRGLQIQDDTALVNVTEAFAEACRDLTQTQERNLVYAIVNTLTEIESVKRVRFFVEGTQAQLAGSLFMAGEFLRHPGLIYTEPL